MRKGYNPHVVLDKRGSIFAIATGSDACAEHECGSRPMQGALCNTYGGLSEEALVRALRAGEAVTYPPLLERKRITRNLDKITFQKGAAATGEPVAVLGYSPYGAVSLAHRELEIYRDDEFLAGAWAEDAFALKVVGAKWVSRLERFAKAVRAGEGLFAGTFLERDGKTHLSGVIVALHTGLRPEHRQAIAAAQATWEGSIQLKACSRLDELHALARIESQKQGADCRPGYMSPRWRHSVVGGEVAYWLNPGFGVKARAGTYTFEELARWIKAEKKYLLTPSTTSAPQEAA